MAWRMPNVFFLAPGATIVIPFFWRPGVDHGPQWVMAHPLPGEPDVWLDTERVGKRLICEIGQVIINGPAEFRCADTRSSYEYRVWITNRGSAGCRFQVEGGGV